MNCGLAFFKSPSLLISGSGGGSVRELPLARAPRSVFGFFALSKSCFRKNNSELDLWAVARPPRWGFVGFIVLPKSKKTLSSTCGR